MAHSTLVDCGGVEPLDARNKKHRRLLVRMMAESAYPGAWSKKLGDDSAPWVLFRDRVDLDTLRAVVFPHRHVRTGTWILRIDGLRSRPSHVVRTHPQFGTPEYDQAIGIATAFMFISSDYGGLTDFERPWTKEDVLVPQVIAHYARQMFGPNGLASSWPEKTGSDND